tara:strand:- start:289 stop:480 length:192 start_codon:yes stop_codon:yes gene_type:complete
MSRPTLKLNAGAVADRIGFFLQESRDNFARLHINSDALVIEYNDKVTGHKLWEIISTVEKNNS